MQESIERVAASRGVPYVFLARPGIYGSSGDHRQRRRSAESRLVSAAIDLIKQRHGIETLGVAGQSGGGHVVASLLTMRSDIRCAVAASSVSSPRMRWTLRGRSRDMTGYTDSFEPIEHLQAGTGHPQLRVFVLGDPQDTNTPWPSQVVLADRLKERQVAVEVIEGEGTGPENHNLSGSSTLIGALCMKGTPTPAILQRARQGLRG